jgi:hypothetical protein
MKAKGNAGKSWIAESVLLVFLFGATIVGFLFRSDGGINLDTLFYVRQAIDLPKIESNLFPLGYPALLRAVHFFCGDYFWSGKILNGICLLAILAFSWHKNFYFRETCILLCTKAGIGLLPFSFSEVPFLTLLYFLIFLLHSYSQNRPIKGWLFWMLLVFSGLILIRHSAIFLLPAFGFVGLILFVKKGKAAFGEDKLWYWFLVLAAALLTIYLAWNFKSFGSLFGENLRGAPEAMSHSEWMNHIFLNFKGLMGAANPFFTLVFQHGDLGLIGWLVMLPDLFFAGLMFWLFWKGATGEFAKMLLVFSISFLALMFLASLKAGIEVLNTRLLAPGLWLLYFAFLISFSSKIKSRILFSLAFFSLVINLALLLKTPASYLKIRERARLDLARKPEAKYFLVDKDHLPLSSYPIPFTGKVLKYQHPVLAQSYINRHALMMLRPELQELDSISARLHSEVEILRNSDCGN